MKGSYTAGSDFQVSSIPGNVLDTVRYQIATTSYSGHVVSNEAKKDHLFYWFLATANERHIHKPDAVPIIMWLNGGPGYSSLAGLVTENGPFQIARNDTGTISPNPQSWNQVAHLLYWDQPVGTGYSYSESKNYVTNETELREQLYAALQEFLGLYPAYRACPLYIAGESYAGKYVPNIATEIMRRNAEGKDDPINMRGLAIGDGWMRPMLQLECQIRYAFELGFLDTKQRERVESLYQECCAAYQSGDMKEAYEKNNEVSDAILNCAGQVDIYDVRRRADDSDDLLKSYFNSDATKKALHVPKDVEWKCADDKGPVSKNLEDDNMKDVTGLLPDLISKYRVLLYTGNFDMSCGFSGTEKILQDQRVVPYSEWPQLVRQVWIDPLGKTLGYHKSHQNLTQITIPYAGHMVPMDNAQAARDMIANWVLDRDFTTYPPDIGA